MRRARPHAGHAEGTEIDLLVLPPTAYLRRPKPQDCDYLHQYDIHLEPVPADHPALRADRPALAAQYHRCTDVIQFWPTPDQ